MDDAVQGPAADLRQAAVRLNGPAPALLPAHEIQQQGLRVLQESEPRVPGGAGVGGVHK